jgi:hypothetical protein
VRLQVVMAGLDPAIYVLTTGADETVNRVMRGPSPRMTTVGWFSSRHNKPSPFPEPPCALRGVAKRDRVSRLVSRSAQKAGCAACCIRQLLAKLAVKFIDPLPSLWLDEKSG